MASQALDRPVSKSAPYRLLDSWRGVAAFWVVMVHACLPTIANESPQLRYNPLYIFSLWGGLGVQIFFVISGYCIAAAAVSTLRKPNPIIGFVRARLRRIYPPYFFSSIGAVLLSLLYMGLAAHHIIPKQNHPIEFLHQPFKYYFSAITLTQKPLHVDPIINIYWSLCYEITFYLIVTVLMAATMRKSRSAFLVSLNVVTLASLVWLIVAPKTCIFPFDLWPQFGIGAMVYMLISHAEEKSTRYFFGAAIALSLCYAALSTAPSGLGHLSTRIQTIVCLAFSLLLLALYRYDALLIKNRFINFLAWLGTFSYSIYLAHKLVMPIVQQLAKKVGFANGTYWVSFLIQIVVSIAFAYLFHLVCERPFLSTRAKVREDQVHLVKTAPVDAAPDSVAPPEPAVG